MAVVAGTGVVKSGGLGKFSHFEAFHSAEQIAYLEIILVFAGHLARTAADASLLVEIEALRVLVLFHVGHRLLTILADNAKRLLGIGSQSLARVLLNLAERGIVARHALTVGGGARQVVVGAGRIDTVSSSTATHAP